jgi:two-component system nitrogen regulation sensor histidine kinase NtrY
MTSNEQHLPAPSPGAAVLIVVGDAGLADALASVLHGRGHTSRIEVDLEVALACLADVDVVILDERVSPDPAAAFARVRRFAGPDTALLAVTGDEARAETLLAAGASDFLVVPCSLGRIVGRLAAVERDVSIRAGRRAAERQRQESHRALATLIANLPGVVYRCANDHDWTMHFISEGCTDLTGHTPDDFMSGRVSFGEQIHPDDRERVWDQVQQSVAQRRPFRLQYRLGENQKTRWIWEQGQGVFAPSGELLAIEGFITDMSELRRTQLELEEREVLLETLLAVTTTAYILCNGEGAIVYANLAAQTWLKLPDSRLVGARFAEVLTALPEELRDAVGRGRDSIFTVDHQNGDFEAYHLVMRNVQIGGRPHIAYAFKRLTRELARQEVEVWKKVIRLIAHEINNTLAPISSLLHSARLINAAEARDARLDRIIDTISERSKHLGEFLKGYTEFARLPRPRLELVKWRQLIDRLEDLVQFQLDAAPEDLNTFSAIDRSQIEQALINLLKNAVEANGPVEEVALRLRTSPEGDEIQVLDRGPGIPPELLSKVLLPFYSTKRTGSGLGLPLCREIVEAHGGSLRIEAREGGGTAVIIFLPRLVPQRPS